MKRFLSLLVVVATLAACQTKIFNDLPQTGNNRPIVPARLVAGDNTLYITDYLPEWEKIDSITSNELTVAPIVEDWSEFRVTAPEGTGVATFEVWNDGRSLSVVALMGASNDVNRIFSVSQMMHVVAVETTEEVDQIVAMWQNCRLPEACNLRNDKGFEVIIPKDATEQKYSFLRVFAANDQARFNDLMIPLVDGKVVREAEQLTRHHREAQVLYSLMIDRFYDADSTNNQPLNQPDARVV